MTGFLFNVLMTILPIAIVLGVVVTVHELGHFLAARAFGTAVDRFSIGFGRAIAQWRDKAGVEWRIGWLPLGGYVRFAGDDNAASIPDVENLAAMRRSLVAREGEAAVSRYFHFKPIWQRAIIVAAGPFANFLLAVLIFAALLTTVGEPISPARVDSVRPGSPAARAGFQVGDVVLQAGGRKIESFTELKGMVILRTGTPMDFVVQRGDRKIAITATPERGVIVDRLGHRQRLGQLGLGSAIRPGDITIRRYAPPQALVAGTERTWDVIETTVRYLGRLVVGRETAEQLSGPVGMAQLSTAISKQTVEASADLPSAALNLLITILELTANISVGIGFLNLLPVPVLDGGHLLFYAYEAVARRPLAARFQAAGFRLGLALVLGLMLFATWNDLQRLRVFSLLGGLFS
jgi:regulator of sigma E protease